MGESEKPVVRTRDGTVADPYTGEVLPAPIVTSGLHPGPLYPDLKTQLEQWHDNREYVRAFLTRELKESEYNEKGRPIKGRMHDYYRLPGQGEPEWRPTAVGAEKVAQFFGLFKGPPELQVVTETKEYVSVRARVILVDSVGRVRGSAEKVISSAEATFQEYDGSGLLKKYKGDARAALNDIASRAAKRAYVEAVSITCALGEIFNEIARARAGEPKRMATAPTSTTVKRADPKPDAHGLPTVMPVGTHAGTPLKALTTEYLQKAALSCAGRADLNSLADAINNVLEDRRLENQGGP